jgi:hypothetical protein
MVPVSVRKVINIPRTENDEPVASAQEACFFELHIGEDSTVYKSKPINNPPSNRYNKISAALEKERYWTPNGTNQM